MTGNQYIMAGELCDMGSKKIRYAFNSLYILWKYHFGDVTKPCSVEAVKVSLKNSMDGESAGERKRDYWLCVMTKDSYVYFDKEGTAGV